MGMESKSEAEETKLDEIKDKLDDAKTVLDNLEDKFEATKGILFWGKTALGIYVELLVTAEGKLCAKPE